MDWPAPIFATIEEYQAAAILVGGSYDYIDHTIMLGHGDAASALCPDTMEHVYLLQMGEDSWLNVYDERVDAVHMRALGPKAHPKYQRR